MVSECGSTQLPTSESRTSSHPVLPARRWHAGLTPREPQSDSSCTTRQELASRIAAMRAVGASAHVRLYSSRLSASTRRGGLCRCGTRLHTSPPKLLLTILKKASLCPAAHFRAAPSEQAAPRLCSSLPGLPRRYARPKAPVLWRDTPGARPTGVHPLGASRSGFLRTAARARGGGSRSCCARTVSLTHAAAPRRARECTDYTGISCKYLHRHAACCAPADKPARKRLRARRSGPCSRPQGASSTRRRRW
jgi:hypothetical protein